MIHKPAMVFNYIREEINIKKKSVEVELYSDVVS